MATLRDAMPRAGIQSLAGSVEIQTDAENAFALLCAVEKWPVWLSFLRSAELVEGSKPLSIGSEVVVRSAIPGESEQLFEVDQFITNHHLSLVGAYSVRRRLEFRIERKTSRSKLHARLDYPAYGGKLGLFYDSMLAARKLANRFQESLTQFKHLAEFDRGKDALLADF